MADYIESEFNPCDVCDYKRCSNCILHELAMKVVGHPIADVALVVRCGECERRSKSADLTDTIYCPWLKQQMKKTDFCSYGERKENNT